MGTYIHTDYSINVCTDVRVVSDTTINTLLFSTAFHSVDYPSTELYYGYLYKMVGWSIQSF